MDQVSHVKMNFRKEQWKQRITDCQASGMSVKRWCKENQLCEQTYYRYLRLIRQEMCDTLPIPTTMEEEIPVAFKKPEVQSHLPDTQAAVIIHLPSASVEARNGANQQTVEAVLLALHSLCQVISWSQRISTLPAVIQTCANPLTDLPLSCRNSSAWILLHQRCSYFAASDVTELNAFCGKATASAFFTSD